MTGFFTLLRKSLSTLSRFMVILLVAWLVVTIALPFILRYISEQTFLQALALAVLIQVLIVLQVLYRAWGWWGMIRAALGVVLLVWIAAGIGNYTAFPFGRFKFTEALQPQIFRVPLLIPLIWLMMLPPAWAVARLITHKMQGCLVRPAFILVSALVFTAWDFCLDPLLARWGIIDWSTERGYFGVPWMSFAGWLVVSGIITLIVSPKRLPSGLLVLVYSLTWLVDFLTLFFLWDLPGPALVGFFLMGGSLFWGAFNTK